MRTRQQVEHQAAVGVGREDKWSRQLRGAEQRNHVVDVLLHAMWLRHLSGPVRTVGPGVGPVVCAHPCGLGNRRLGRVGAGAELRLRDDVVWRGSDRVIGRHNDIPRFGIATLAGNDEHRRRACALTVEKQLPTTADVEQPGRPGIGRTARAPTRRDREDRKQRATRSPHKATLHRQAHHHEHDRDQRKNSLRDGRARLVGR